ncbi:hypothetical protein [Dechloromonas sp. H13]|uniref:hypothetical protein n=1 Tax=Dechloromonas sp. H13 TaxID=2570193 RepID=UPI0012913174|nr:hypothetical protein [Dechloromonas sp. H13]
MRKVSQLPMIALCAGLLAGSVQAAPLNILGFDDMSCAAWIASKGDADQRNLYVVWIRGFLTGHNYGQQGQQVSSISSGTIEVNVNSYCAQHPTGLFSDAAFRLSDQFSGRNQPLRK